MISNSRHCIVTPDFIGPIRNGGIGTACYELAKFLQQRCGADVTVLFTSTVTVDSAEKWQLRYRQEHGWRFLTMDDLAPLPDIPHHNCRWFLARSLQIDRWLRDEQFTHIHFQDWHANGFVPMQAKRAGSAYAETLLTCTIHSPEEWSEEGNLLFPDGGVDSMLQRYCEKYAASHADISIFPSRHMLAYVQAKDWRIGNPVVAPYLCGGDRAAPKNEGTAVTELCFFGRLETRKGLEVFVDALDRLAGRKGSASLPKVTFLGKPGLVASGDSLKFIEDFRKRHDLQVAVIGDFDSVRARAYLKADPGRLAVVPSLLDNLPYVVIECLRDGIPIIASKVGGIPELIGSEMHLFHPTAKDLEVRLHQILREGCPPVDNLHDLPKAEAWWEAAVSGEFPPDGTGQPVEPHQISVCIAYYNHGAYLPALLESLDNQTVGGFAVIVVNDGSTDDYSDRVFNDMAAKYAAKPEWNFVRQDNGGIGAARNHAASLAATEYLVFMDADNLAKPGMIEQMAAAMGRSGADCLTCYMEGFAEDHPGRREIIYRYIPTGNCPEAGCFENIFGDANCIVRRDVFHELGGFSLDRDSSFEDWEFLARLSLEGKRLDVLPEFLHLYRHTAQGFSRTTSPFRNRRRILQAYRKHLPDWGGRLLECAYASVADAKDVTRPRGPHFAVQQEFSPASLLAMIGGLTSRTARVLSQQFDATRYVSRYRHILSRKGGFTDWARIPRTHFVFFGDDFPN
jgi:glycosyltransferase involved in cell wall biosynthesis